MEEGQQEEALISPCKVSLMADAAGSSLSSRLLSSDSRPTRDPPPAPPAIAWLSLDGHLVGAEEACSASRVASWLPNDEKIAWELFPPIHRVLIVAVAAAAAVYSEKNSRIAQLRRSIEMRDQVLVDMQTKLDNLAEKLRLIEDQCRNFRRRSSIDVVEFELDDGGKVNCVQYFDRTSEIRHDGLFESNMQEQFSVQHLASVDCAKMEAVETHSGGTEKFPLYFSSYAEQEEQRMSDLSDWCSTITYTGEQHQVATDQEIFNLRKQCEDKDSAIKELYALSHASDTAGSKRISKLEDVVRRENTTVTELKKDMLILQEKVLQLTRQQKPSLMDSNADSPRFPAIATNVVYDIDISTSPSSSDSDCPEKNAEASPLEAPEPSPVSPGAENAQPSTSKVNIASSNSKNHSFQTRSSSSVQNSSNSKTIQSKTAQRFGRTRLQDPSVSRSSVSKIRRI